MKLTFASIKARFLKPEPKPAPLSNVVDLEAVRRQRFPIKWTWPMPPKDAA